MLIKLHLDDLDVVGVVELLHHERRLRGGGGSEQRPCGHAQMTVVETEGNWSFGDPVLRKPFAEVTEEDVIAWVKADSIREGKNIIESRLEEQVIALEKQKVIPPWLPQVFTPNLG